MAVENDFLPFAVGGSANVLTQAEYAALTSLLQNGFQSGIANSQQLNKVWRQSSIMAAVLAQFIVNQTGQPAIDDGTMATLLANFAAAVNAASKNKIVLTDTGTANAYAAANPVPLTALPTTTGFVQTVKIAHLNTGASTYAPDGLATAPIFGLGGGALQGNELPVNGIATLVSFVDPLLNSGALCWVLYECVGGAQPVAPATASQHAVQLSQLQASAALIGSRTNCAGYTAGSVNTFGMNQCDEFVVGKALGGQVYKLANVTGTLNTATVGANGMDTGSPPNSGFVAVYVIYNPTTSTTALLGTTMTAGVSAPTVYGGSNMPAGYTASGLLAVLRTNSSGQFLACRLSGTIHSIQGTSILSISGTSSVSVWTVLNASSTIPPNAKIVIGNLNIGSASTAGVNTLQIGGDSSGVGAAYAQGYQSTISQFRVPCVINSSNLYYQIGVGAGTANVNISCAGYEI